MSNFFRGIFVFAVVMLSMPALAFKVDTHVWIGQQIINDLEEDGKLTIDLNGKPVILDVPSDVRNAILANRSSFLMGNIGPDAAPDVLVGQTVMHPGVKDIDGNNIGWQTNDWLSYLLEESKNNEVGKAYTYGYLGHASADVFAHTYVNQYAGDIFSLADETLVEQRHFVLESFIGNHTPPLKDYQGNSLGATWENVGVNEGLALFVRDTLIYNNQVQNEYWKVPTAGHLAAYYQYRKAIDSLAEAGIWHEIDVAVLLIVAAYFDIELSYDDASDIVDAAQPVLDFLNGDVPDYLQEKTNNLYEELSEFDADVFGHVSDALDAVKSAEYKVLDLHSKLLDEQDKLLDKVNCPSFPPSPSCETRKRRAEDTNRIIRKVIDKIRDDLLDEKNDMRNKVLTLRDEAVKAYDAWHTIKNNLNDLAQLWGADVSPIQAVLRGWRSDVDIATTEYVKAANQVMINTMNPDPDVSAIDPMVEWFDCYHMSIIGLYSYISGCEFRDSIATLKDSLQNITTILDESRSLGGRLGIPTPLELLELKDIKVDEYKDKIKDKAGEELKEMLPLEIQDLLSILEDGVDDFVLNYYFTQPETVSPAKGLIMIDDMAERVKSEMYLTNDGYLDPNKYAVIYNAVTLAKLSLLDKYGFEQLAIAAKSNDYAALMYRIDNIVAQAFGNIDGNHQWMLTPPPTPNSFGFYSPVTETYSSNRSEVDPLAPEGLGFPLWTGDMRSKIFRAIFKGPLSPGIDTPDLIDFPRLVGQEYPYHPCSAYPFPDNIRDRTCTAILLIPIFSLLSN